MAHQRKIPTHRVKHIHGWELQLHISSALQARLKSRDESVRQSAREAVCTYFRMACRTKAEREGSITNPPRWVLWEQLTITPIEVVPPPPAIERQCCDNDNCVVCDIGNHHYCPSCTLY